MILAGNVCEAEALVGRLALSLIVEDLKVGIYQLEHFLSCFLIDFSPIYNKAIFIKKFKDSDQPRFNFKN